MMARPLNPFDPGRPISPGEFVGRHDEIAELEAALQHTKAGKPRHFLLTGGRGIGKTSFLDYIRKRATNTEGVSGFNYLVVDFAVDKSTTRLDLVRSLQSDLNQILSMHEPLKDVLMKSWAFLQRFEVGGVSYSSPTKSHENHHDMYKALADSLCQIVDKACEPIGDNATSSGYDGLLVLIDELDQASDELDIGSFLKFLLERINRKGCHKVVVGLAGLSESIEVLVKSHRSSLRIFDELSIEELGWDDIEELMSEITLKVRNEGYPEFEITDSAKRRIFELSAGHPHFMHQFGYCAFERACRSASDSRLIIDEMDVINGAFESRGALEMIGDMYFEQPLESLHDDAKAIELLNILVKEVDEMSREDLCARLEVDADRANLLCSRLGRIGFISHDAGRNRYRVRYRCLSYWLESRVV